MNRSQASIKSGGARSGTKSEMSIIKDEFNLQTPAEKIKIFKEMEEILKEQNFEHQQLAKEEVKARIPRNRAGRQSQEFDGAYGQKKNYDSIMTAEFKDDMPD